MNKEEKFLSALKRLVNVLSSGKNDSREYLGTRLYKAEIHLLEIIGQNQGINPNEIAQKMQVTKGAVSQIISKLISKQLIEKVIYAKDSRSHDLHLTEEGKKVFQYHQDYERENVQMMINLLHQCNPNDIQIFEQIIEMTISFVKR